MKSAKKQKKILNKNNKNTFDAKVDVVSYPENIQYFSYTREDYTELALNAIYNNPHAIKYVSPQCKDYEYICSVAINESPSTFLEIDESASNYKELGMKALMVSSAIVCELKKSSKYYIFFWKFAIGLCLHNLGAINNDRKELFFLIAQVLDNDPKAIYYVDSELEIYNNLCIFAYGRDVESLDYMDVSKLNEYLLFKAIRRNPRRVLEFDGTNKYYKKALEDAIALDGSIFSEIVIYEEDINFYYSLFELAKITSPDVVNSSNAVLLLCLDNRRQKDNLILNANDLDSIDKALDNLDAEYKSLIHTYKELLDEKLNKQRKQFSYGVNPRFRSPYCNED